MSGSGLDLDTRGLVALKTPLATTTGLTDNVGDVG